MIAVEDSIDGEPFSVTIDGPRRALDLVDDPVAARGVARAAGRSWTAGWRFGRQLPPQKALVED
jgi:hypothetical protein